MEISEWDALLDDEDSSGLVSEESIEELMSDTGSCLYCRLGELGEGDDD